MSRRFGAHPARTCQVRIARACSVLRLVLVPAVLLTCNGRVLFDPNGCDRDDECRLSTLHCDTGTRSCVACTADAHCAAGTTSSAPTGRTTCDLALHRCVECVSDDNCLSGQLCRENRCVTTCHAEGSDPACTGVAAHCEAQGGMGICIECEDDNRTCAAISTAGTICNHKLGRCVSCLSNANCGGTNPRCDTVEGRCVVCLSSADCGSDLPVCDPVTLECVAQP